MTPDDGPLDGLTALWSARAAPAVATAVAAIAVIVVVFFVDVSPRVEGEFFFAEDDPQMQALQAVQERFPMGAQLIVRAADLGGDRAAYLRSIEGLTRDLLEVEGIDGGFSVATQDPASPLFSRVLLTPDPNATNVVLQADGTDPETLLPRVEAVVDAYASDELELVVSGVPAIVEMIRRSLYRDLVVFSLSAVLVFALLIGAVYRDVAVVVGTLATCFVSVAATLVTVQAMGVPIGLLTANLVTIVFVLTLSHVVFITANWRRASATAEARGDALARGLRATVEGSFWSMATTLLGFLSLLVATARPLRELGVAGAVGTVTALVVAYAMYPAFLGRWAAPRREGTSAVRLRTAPWARGAIVGIGVAVFGIAIGAFRVDTDPGLLTYFSEGSEIREGLSRIDADGGTSTLDLVVRASDRTRIDAPPTFAAMQRLQAALDEDPAVGVVLSPTVLIAHARTLPLAGFLPVPTLLDIASSDRLDRVALGFVTPERDVGRFSLRMRETVPEDRRAVMARLEAHAEGAGLEVAQMAGLYDLQAQLGTLIASSLRIGIGGLLLLFLGVALVVSRAPAIAGRMWLCLVAIPLVILGCFGHFGIAVDIITSPAANIALAMGADSMIHLVVRVRTLAAAGEAAAWAAAVAQIGPPVLGATAIVCAGFGIFVLSSFPPTQRFGLAVIVGTLAAATMALVVLPSLTRRGDVEAAA